MLADVSSAILVRSDYRVRIGRSVFGRRRRPHPVWTGIFFRCSRARKPMGLSGLRWALTLGSKVFSGASRIRGLQISAPICCRKALVDPSSSPVGSTPGRAVCGKRAGSFMDGSWSKRSKTKKRTRGRAVNLCVPRRKPSRLRLASTCSICGAKYMVNWSVDFFLLGKAVRVAQKRPRIAD